ncbi:DUF317 domain-containing protein [Kitasatospora sp. LaBMicrA B282]|uniref:DUF317 domain-containing protein n=1 Tax=Kitasatospora sp. LaBMicrA B282 TaxID=3420949 RepID=UPI003D0BCC36
MPATTPLLVRPRHLAGPGEVRLITAPLDVATGWTRTRTPDGVLLYTSPCRRALVTHEDSGTWTVREYRAPGAEVLWRATFSPGTPSEIAGAFTGTLIDGLRSVHRDYLEGGPRHQPGSPASTLAQRGWRPDPGPKGFHHQVSPDGRALYRHRVGYQPADVELEGRVPSAWSMLVGDPHRPSWRADFTIGTPFYLLTHAALAFSDPAPAKRHLGDIPEHHLPHVTARPASATAAPSRPQHPISTPPAVVPSAAAPRRR